MVESQAEFDITVVKNILLFLINPIKCLCMCQNDEVKDLLALRFLSTSISTFNQIRKEFGFACQQGKTQDYKNKSKTWCCGIVTCEEGSPERVQVKCFVDGSLIRSLIKHIYKPTNYFQHSSDPEFMVKSFSIYIVIKSI